MEARAETRRPAAPREKRRLGSGGRRTRDRRGNHAMNFVVTGAASGIGCRLVSQLAAAGHSGVATDLDAARLERSAAECGWPSPGVSLMRHDVASPQAWSELMARVAER